MNLITAVRTQMPDCAGSRHRSRGAALVVSLVLLVAVTLLGVSAMQGTILQERMSANQRDVEEAFNAAEIALRRGETELCNNQSAFFDAPPVPFAARTWHSAHEGWAGEGWAGDGFTVLANVFLGSDLADLIVADPKYYVAYRSEVIRNPGATVPIIDEVYTIMARGSGRSANILALLQSTILVEDGVDC